MERLSLENLPENTDRFSYDRDSIGIGIVHLGLGAFHKGHQAVYTDDVLIQHGGDWGICGVSLRRPKARDDLMPQDGLYTLVVKDTGETKRRVIGAIKEVLVAPENPKAVIDKLASKTTHIVTLTITEKGYCVDPSTKTLDITHPDVAHDLKNLDAPKSAIGYLVAALIKMQQAGAGSLTIISCDNMPHNGRVLKDAVLDFARAFDMALAQWIESEIAFPSTMVDRIVPATTPEDIAENVKAIGVDDHGVTKTEPFCQWVIEDNFSGPRPKWEDAGAMIVSDVTAFEDAKLRLLNGPHSAIAYMGVLFNKPYVHDVMADPEMGPFVRYLMEQEIAATVEAPEGMPLGPYMEQLCARFENETLEHSTQQISNDGSQKLPQRILAPLMARMDMGLDSPGLTMVLAIWMECVARSVDPNDSLKLEDPLHHIYEEVLGDGGKGAKELISALFSISEIFPESLAQNTSLCAQVLAHIEGLRHLGFKGDLAA